VGFDRHLRPTGRFGLGRGASAYAPDEYWVIDSANPNVAAMAGAFRLFVDLFGRTDRRERSCCLFTIRRPCSADVAM